jgi:hypothetical protein
MHLHDREMLHDYASHIQNMAGLGHSVGERPHAPS